MSGADKRRELIDGLMGRGVESHRWAIKSLDGKARAILTAGTIVLGIAMGGIGTVAGLAGGPLMPNWQLSSVPAHVVCAVVGSLVAIFLSVLFAVLALRVFKVTGFGNPATFMGNETDTADKGRINDWIAASDEEVYEQVYDARVRELTSLHRQGESMGLYITMSQASLLVGLALSVAWAAMLVWA